ncbi:MAG TPA: helix-turn-helix transcriptional regulator [Spirochaetia bacterium]|nr:helix-turn-helix transcriptional regulator [Spirochaetia bacterium]
MKFLGNPPTTNFWKTASLPPLAWGKINDFLLQVCAARNLDEFSALVCTHIADLVRHDFPILCVTLNSDDILRFGREHPNERIDPGILAVAGERGTTADFNQYFRHHLPMTTGYLLDRLVADFRPFENTEFVTDFVRPRRVQRCLGGWFRRYTTIIPRCRHASLFSDQEIAISKIISPHLENFYDVLSLAAASPEKSRLQAMRAEASQAGLTQRELEIALLLSERLSMMEIADRLFISRRTVEKHAENIYLKLGIKRKQEVGMQLLSFRPYPMSS